MSDIRKKQKTKNTTPKNPTTKQNKTSLWKGLTAGLRNLDQVLGPREAACGFEASSWYNKKVPGVKFRNSVNDGAQKRLIWEDKQKLK